MRAGLARMCEYNGSLLAHLQPLRWRVDELPHPNAGGIAQHMGMWGSTHAVPITHGACMPRPLAFRPASVARVIMASG